MSRWTFLGVFAFLAVSTVGPFVTAGEGRPELAEERYTAQVNVLHLGRPVAGAVVIACGDEGKTMTDEAATGEDGCCTLTVPVSSCRLRVAYADDTLWSDEVFLLPDEPTQVVLDLYDLARQPTNDPNPGRVDGAQEGAPLLASIGPDSDQAGSAPLGREWKIYYYINDHLGTPVAMIDEDGREVWRADLLPFGEALNETGPMVNPFRFPGQYRDGETGLHYNWNRYYLPKLSRYGQADPLQGDLSRYNLYNYVRNSPLLLEDFNGLEVFNPGDLLGYKFDRSPDYYSVSIALGMHHRVKTKEFIGWGVRYVRDRYGRWYFTPAEPGVGFSLFPIAFSATSGWIDQCETPDKEELKHLLQGASANACAGYVIGAGYSFIMGSGGMEMKNRALEIGLFSPQISLSSEYRLGE